MKHKGSCAIEADVTKIRPRLVSNRKAIRRGGHKLSNRTASLFTFARGLMVIYNRHRFYRAVKHAGGRLRIELHECERCGAAKEKKEKAAAA